MPPAVPYVTRIDLIVSGDQVVRVAGRVVVAGRVLAHDLARVRVVGGDDDERVRVLALVVERDADRLVERDGLTDLRARVGGVVLLVDRGALDLQEEPVLVALEQARAPCVVMAARLGSSGGRLVGDAALGRRAVAERRDRAAPLGRHVDRGEETEQRLVALGRLQPVASVTYW